jgi:hypothetical protein
VQAWLLLLTLYAAPDADPHMFLLPGIYTKSECAMVKAMLDRDHTGAFANSDGDDLTRVFVRSWVHSSV